MKKCQFSIGQQIVDRKPLEFTRMQMNRVEAELCKSGNPKRSSIRYIEMKHVQCRLHTSQKISVELSKKLRDLATKPMQNVQKKCPEFFLLNDFEKPEPAEKI